MKYKKMKIQEIFEKCEIKKIKGKANDFPEEKKGEYVIPLLTAGINNQGLARYAKKESCPTILKNVLSVSANGANSGAVFYQPYDFAVLQDAYALKLINKDIPNKNVGLFLATLLNKSIKDYHDWSNKAGWEKIKNNYISIPINNNNEINFEYMEYKIKELEEEKINKLDTYLKEANLDNYILTEEEKFILPMNKHTKKYKIGDLFDIHPTKSYGLTNYKLFNSIGKTPVVVNSSQNNGIGGYVDREPTEKGNMITFSDTTTSDGIFYQPNDFIGYSHVQGLYAKKELNLNWTEKSLLYFLSLFRKCAKNRFDYANKFNRKIASEMEILLPINENDEIDFEYMEKYIKAIEKTYIKNLVDWKNKELKTYKNIIN